MPKDVEKCVSEIKGNNKKTGKPYTRSEKYAICTAANNKAKSDLDLEQIGDTVANATFNYAMQMYNAKRVPTMTIAYELAQVALARYNYDYEALEMTIGK
jgi:hypothetical protein